MGEWVGAYASIIAVTVAINLSNQAGRRAEKSEREALELRDRYERAAVQPEWVWHPLSWGGTVEERQLKTALFDVGREPAHDVVVEVVKTDVGLLKDRKAIRRHLACSPTGKTEPLTGGRAWRFDVQFPLEPHWSTVLSGLDRYVCLVRTGLGIPGR